MLGKILRNFFTHKDFLPPPEQWPGTLFTPMQILFCLAVAVWIGFACVQSAKKGEAHLKKVYFVLWVLAVVTEFIITFWEMYAGKAVQFELENMLPFWPCSIFYLAAPFAVFGKGNVRQAACGYFCTLGLLGGVVNFVYPATYISRYSCLSLAGLRTIFFHGSLIFIGVTMLLSGYHSYGNVHSRKQLLLPAMPMLLMSVPANIVNFTVPGTDYMFFKMESFFFAPVGRVTPDWLTVILVYGIYLLLHAAPYLPSYFAHKKEASTIE